MGLDRREASYGEDEAGPNFEKRTRKICGCPNRCYPLIPEYPPRACTVSFFSASKCKLSFKDETIAE